MPELELWFTKLLNDLLAGPVSSLLAALHIQVENPARPIPNYVAMEILVALIIMALFVFLRMRLSMDRPGVTQHIFELFHDFVAGQAKDQVGHNGHKVIPMVMTLAVFILFSNLIGLIPGFESPTNFFHVTFGCTMVAWFYYHSVGLRTMGPVGYVKHFCGPVWWLAPIMFPIELFSHGGRLVSLSVRLYANMFAGEQVFLVFLHMTKLFIPIVFMGLHVFVAFLQTYIFMLLTLIYLGGMSHEEHHEHAAEALAHS